jgi:hypothetical protein
MSRSWKPTALDVQLVIAAESQVVNVEPKPIA